MSARMGRLDDFRRWLHEWDWRPLARLIAWTLIAARFGYLSYAGLAHVGRELLLSWLLTFGILTHLQFILLMGGVRLYLILDDAAYRLAERIVRPLLGGASFAGNFLAAFAVEVALAFGGAWAWRTWHMGARLLAMADAAWRATCG